jgi:hypothetical protein
VIDVGEGRYDNELMERLFGQARLKFGLCQTKLSSLQLCSICLCID